MAGGAAGLLWRFGRRSAVVLRMATLLPIAAVALLRVSAQQLAATASVVGVMVVWTCAYGWWLLRAEGRLPVVVDVVVLLGVCLSVFWTGAVEETNVGWIRLLITFACVTYQWHTSLLAGGIAALVVDGGLLVAAAATGADGSVLKAIAWVLVAAALSRTAWVLVERAAARADRMTAEAERARRESLVAAAVRAEERELANALHDTAATTLLMVGTGQVPANADWLGPQARRDLDRLRSDGARPRGHADLVELLRADLDAVHLDVEFDGPALLPLPSGVARAIADAAGEALNNVRRHAGTERVAVRLRGDAVGLRLDIADEGSGFSADDVPATRRGLRDSVRGRMSRVGGTAVITSTVGSGTVVRLEWGHGRG
ncbi:sensor histidine kinase [Qaidamihabitans albus]|uniref:sensor histidine kinase n=1 Tax=Qaidamihabitans albus TaxID=2795733 RepID=UPI0018F15962|nr:ATP-binding protein [Qaidamihabitans albus]